MYLGGIPFAATAQAVQPVRWNVKAEPYNNDQVSIIITASLDEGWHIYSQFMEEGGPMPTSFVFDQNSHYELIGKTEEHSEPVEKFDDTFMMPVIWFENKAVFIQRIQLHEDAAVVKGSVEFMACMDDICLLPEKKRFSVEVNDKQIRTQ